MRRVVMILLLAGALVYPSAIFAQNSSSSSAVCTFTDGNQISLRYNEAKYSPKDQPPYGKAWSPDGVRMDLFTQAALNISNTVIPAGAYSFYFIPEKDAWTFVINKDVTAGAPYNQQADLARKKMGMEKLDQTEQHLNIYFGHLAPKQCTMRVDYGKVRAVGDILEQ